MRVAAVGDNCIDIYKEQNRYYPTGNCVDFAVNIRKLGVEVTVVSLTGTDHYGDELIEMLKKYDVDASHLHRKEGKTGTVLMQLVGNDRLHTISDPGVFADFDLTKEDLEFIKGYDVIHSVIWGNVNGYMKTFKEWGKTIVYDFATDLDDPEIQKLLPYVDYGFFSYKQDDDFIREYLKDCCEKGLKVAIATLGEHGSIAYDGKKYYLQEALPVTVVNTVGAGDSFISGYTYGVIGGQDGPGCLRSGAEMSAKIIQLFDPY